MKDFDHIILSQPNTTNVLANEILYCVRQYVFDEYIFEFKNRTENGVHYEYDSVTPRRVVNFCHYRCERD